MTTFEPRPKPPVLKRQGFLLCEDKFSVEEETRVDGSRLFELFHTDLIQGKSEREAAAAEAKRLLKKPFLAAQLRFYGVKYSTAAAKGELYDQLKNAVDAGQCNQVPQSVVQLEADMRKDYEEAFASWKEVADMWDEENKDRPMPVVESPPVRKRGRPRKNPDVPPKQATPGRGRGRPRKNPDTATSTKTTAPEILPVSMYGTGPGPGPVAGTPHSAPAKGRGRPRKDLDATGTPTGLTTSTPVGNGRPSEIANHSPMVPIGMSGQLEMSMMSSGSRAPRPLELRQCRGSYSLICETIMGSDIGSRDNLTLDICDGPGDGTLRGAIVLGFVEGTLILSRADAIINAVGDAAAREDNDDEQQDEGGYHGLGKRITAPSKAPGRPKKYAKPTPPPPSRRLNFRWRGRDLLQGGIYQEPQAGFVEFNDSCTAIRGEININSIGPGIAFRGRKIDKAPRRQPEEWFCAAGISGI